MWNPTILSILFLTALLATSTALPATQDGAVHKMLLPTSSEIASQKGIINELKLFKAINATLKKYHADFVLPPFKELQLSANVSSWSNISVTQVDPNNVLHSRQSNQALSDDNDLAYSGLVRIGSSDPRNFVMDFDTGSSDIILPGPRCGQAQGCPRPTKYQNEGKKLQGKATYVYGGGNATGDEYQDSVTVAGLTYKQQDLLSVSSATLFTSGTNSYDGLFGMAFTGASGSVHTTFMENLIADNQLTYPEFSFYLGRAFNGNTGQDSTLTIGGRDNDKYNGTITQIPVVNQTAWIVELSDISINSESAGNYISGLAAIDTGTSFIVVPSSSLAPIFALIPGAVSIPLATSGDAASASNNLIVWAYPCNTSIDYMPTFHLGNETAGGYGEFTLDVEDFNLGIVDGTFAASLAQRERVSQQEVEGRGLCLSSVLGVRDNVNPGLYVLGIPFIKSWYSVFHYGKKTNGSWAPYVGFAKSVN